MNLRDTINISKGIIINYCNLLKTYNHTHSINSEAPLIHYICKFFKVLFESQTEEVVSSKHIYTLLKDTELDCLIDFAHFMFMQNNFQKSSNESEFFILSQIQLKEIILLTVRKIKEAITDERIFQVQNFTKILV